MMIYLVEDDARVAKFIVQGLKEEGYTVHHFSNGEEAFQAAREGGFDLMILDISVPGKSGLLICRELRTLGISKPILMLTARDSVENRVEGLDAGADDYLVKPFAFSELLARLRALDRRTGDKQTPTQIEVSGLSLDLVGHRVTGDGKPIDLTSREFALLKLFLKRQGHVLSRTVIQESVWGYDFHGGTNVVDVYVNYLRNKLKAATGKNFIQTLRHRGYMFQADA